MIDLYTKIDHDLLYDWIQNLDDGGNDRSCILAHLKTIPRNPEIDWLFYRTIINQNFWDQYIKYKGFGIRIANVFECFVKCTNWETQKKLIKGYGTECVEIGQIDILKDGVIIGALGQKSDLIWNAYYDSFIVEDDDGHIERTLTDDESLLSIQLWNIHDDFTIEERINSYLLDVAFQMGMKFEILYPDDLWKVRGDAGSFQVETKYEYDSIPLAYINYGMNCSDSRVAYLHLYEGIEYYFYKANAKHLKERLLTSDINTIEDEAVLKIFNEFADKQKERDQLELVLQQSIDCRELRNFINNDPHLHNTLKNNYGKGTASITDDLTDDKYIQHLTIRIYLFRCS